MLKGEPPAGVDPRDYLRGMGRHPTARMPGKRVEQARRPWGLARGVDVVLGISEVAAQGPSWLARMAEGPARVELLVEALSGGRSIPGAGRARTGWWGGEFGSEPARRRVETPSGRRP